MMLWTWEPMIQQDWTHYELNLRHPPEPWQVLAGKSERSSSTHWEIGAAAATWSSSSFSSWSLLLPDVLHPSGATIPQVVPSTDTFLGWWSCACPLTDAVLSRLSAGICIWTKWSRPAYCCFFFSSRFFFLLKLKAKNAFVSLLWLQSSGFGLGGVDECLCGLLGGAAVARFLSPTPSFYPGCCIVLWSVLVFSC